jgi:hypothetical protein
VPTFSLLDTPPLLAVWLLCRPERSPSCVSGFETVFKAIFFGNAKSCSNFYEKGDFAKMCNSKEIFLSLIGIIIADIFSLVIEDSLHPYLFLDRNKLW